MVPPGTLLAGVLLALSHLAAATVTVKDGVEIVDKVKCQRAPTNRTIYEFEAENINGESFIDFGAFRGKQEPGANGTEILNTIKYVRPGHGFVPNFPLTEKMEVNGINEHPLWTYLKEYCPSTKNGWVNIAKIFQHPFLNNDVRWNFEKILVDRRGHPYMRYDAAVEPIKGITRDIEKLLRSPTIKPWDDYADDYD